MNKKAQFYIITAVILSGMVLALSSQTRQISPPKDDFEIMYQNYLMEVPDVLNSAIYNENNISRIFTDFSERFIRYADSKGIEFNFAAVILHDNSVFIFNYFDADVKVENGRDNLTLPRKDGAELEKSGWVSIEADGEDYLFNASGDMTQFKAVFKSKRGEDIQVYVYD